MSIVQYYLIEKSFGAGSELSDSFDFGLASAVDADCPHKITFSGALKPKGVALFSAMELGENYTLTLSPQNIPLQIEGKFLSELFQYLKTDFNDGGPVREFNFDGLGFD